jgi:hypothetical protein
MMYPNPRNSDYPGDHLLGLRGIITDEEMRNPTMYDQNNDPRIMAIKRGRTTGLAVGRANDTLSYTRNYLSDNDFGVPRSGLFCPSTRGPASSLPRATQAVVVDGAGRTGGVLTGGGGTTDSSDLSYVTPIDFVLKIIRGNKFLAKAYPKSGPSA